MVGAYALVLLLFQDGDDECEAIGTFGGARGDGRHIPTLQTGFVEGVLASCESATRLRGGDRFATNRALGPVLRLRELGIQSGVVPEVGLLIDKLTELEVLLACYQIVVTRVVASLLFCERVQHLPSCGRVAQEGIQVRARVSVLHFHHDCGSRFREALAQQRPEVFPTALPLVGPVRLVHLSGNVADTFATIRRRPDEKSAGHASLSVVGDCVC